MSFTHEHKTYSISVPGMGSLENRTPSTFHPKEIHKAGPRKASKAKRNFRFNGAERGASPNVASETKYVRSGGPARHEARVTRNIAHQEFLKARAAARRIAGTNRSFDRRSLKAAEHADKAISE